MAITKNDIWFLSLEDEWQKVENWWQEYNNERPHSALGQMAEAGSLRPELQELKRLDEPGNVTFKGARKQVQCHSQCQIS